MAHAHEARPGVPEIEGREHKTTLDRLIYMANQIGWFFKSQPERLRIPGIVDHIQHFWDPRMKKEIFEHVGAGGAGLEPEPLEALKVLKAAHDGKMATRGEAEVVETGQPRTGEAPLEVTENGRG
ncbi:formate dehydrogenase subunit delta [Methylopila henanensis]|uniref:Formate dehydrogenase subunit delta n=1 Tax=Methylopila henanensis TaxID=873516 RepID=A0ABW4K1D2_9HYPH